MSKITINPKFLLAIYSSLIVGMLIILVDTIFFNEELKNFGPRTPTDYLWFTLIFILPHIFASFFGFFDKEYLVEYKPKIIKGALYLGPLAIALPLISLDLTFFVYVIYTMSHVFLQQSGISKSLMRGANDSHRYFQWLGVLISVLVYIDIYSAHNVLSKVTPIGLSFIVLAYLYVGLKASKASKTKLGSMYFWATLATPLIAGLFYLLGYPILTIAAPRVIHDVTAFVFYISHDSNRFLSSGTNYIYRITSAIKIPVVLASPLLAIAVAYPLQSNNRSDVMFTLFLFIFFFHYYAESFMWKRDSLHRKQIFYSSNKTDILG